ncbi:MAG: hypothetical protein P8J27_06705 [Mariniblastus sp.]|nr:hypothetical protein [Mariniblastus sp.]
MNRNSFHPVVWRVWLLIPIVACLVSKKTIAVDPGDFSRCKYSVRDVAFVNVHGKPWQLQLIKPANVETNEFESWNEELRTRLRDSNVGYVWLSADSTEALSLESNNLIIQDGKTSVSQPRSFLTSPDGLTRPMQRTDSFDNDIQLLISSPKRTEVLNQAVDSLCVLVVFECGIEAKDSKARATAESAINRINKQMWTLEKPTDRGPALVVVDAQDPRESGFVNSVGVESRNSPAVAVIYGQGRRLGDLLVGDQITLKKLVGRASVCGQDCECELNRDWLYQQQIIHVWTQELERKAESGLSFDPLSAFVVAEVAQILAKNSDQILDANKVDLGGGLIIHDLGPIPEQDPTSNAPTAREVPPASLENVDLEQESNPSAFPWALLVVLMAITLIVLIFKAKN